MARVIGGIGCSHVPAIGVAMDRGRTEETYWRPLFQGFEFSQRWMAETKPDVAIIVYNDHGSALTLEMIPTFAIGVAPKLPPADEGWGPRPVPVAENHPELAWHIAESLIIDEFDMTIMNEMAVDHGLTVPLQLMSGSVDAWPCMVVPLAVNVVLYPQPSGKRCLNLGRAVKKAVESYDEDLRVVVFGTGGMSHQIHGERCGVINREWDQRFLDGLTQDPRALADIPALEYLRETGAEGIEMVMWLIMRGALDDDVREVYRFYHVPASNTAVGHIILENK